MTGQNIFDLATALAKGRLGISTSCSDRFPHQHRAAFFPSNHLKLCEKGQSGR